MGRLKNKPKRIREFEFIIESFKEKFSDKLPYIQTLDSKVISLRIANDYEQLLDGVIDNYLQKKDKDKEERRRADIFKVCSGVELVTIYISPIKTSNPKSYINVNVMFAFYLAKQFLIQEQEIVKEIKVEHFDEELMKIENMHLDFLRYSKLNEMYLLPTFSNAVFWRAFCYILRSKSSKG